MSVTVTKCGTMPALTVTYPDGRRVEINAGQIAVDAGLVANWLNQLVKEEVAKAVESF